MKTKKYVLVFAFDEGKNRVILIRKTKPEWQKGKLNGIGGKIEDGESPLGAANREFQEEAGVHPLSTIEFGKLSGNGWEIWLYRAIVNMDHVRTMEEEEVCIFWLSAIPYTECIQNLTYLIPMALDINLYKAELSE